MEMSPILFLRGLLLMNQNRFRHCLGREQPFNESNGFVLLNIALSQTNWVSAIFTEISFLWSCMPYHDISRFIQHPGFYRCKPSLTHKQLETNGCVLDTVTTDALVLRHQVISTHSADQMFTVLDRFHKKHIRSQQYKIQDYILKNEPV